MNADPVVAKAEHAVHQAAPWIEKLARLGFLAKALRGMKQALLELFSWGRGPFILVATGLIAYGVYELIQARYRRISTV
jgi:hypothetical protein